MLSGKAVQEFSSAEAARLIGISVSTLRRMAREGWTPTRRDERGRLRFGFSDIARLREVAGWGLRERAAIRAGQLELGLEPDARPVPPPRVDVGRRWYDAALACETTDRDRAIDLYRRQLRLDPTHARSHVNLGRLLHSAGELETAAEHYRAAVAAEPGFSTGWFNLGVLLEDLEQPRAALSIYQRHVLVLDPRDRDAHFNAARLCERLGDELGAVRHLRHVRRLSRV